MTARQSNRDGRAQAHTAGAATGQARAGGAMRVMVATAILTVAGFAVYANALHNPFLLDDQFLIVSDERVHTADFRAIFAQEYWPGPEGNRVWRPLTLASLALNWAVSAAPWTFRLTNLLIHVAAAVAVFMLTRRLTGRFWPALAAGLLFVVHPIHTTPLNQIVDRADIAAAACALWSAWLYSRDGDRTVRRHWVSPLAAAALFAAALLFKESALALVAIVPVMDLFRARGGDVNRASNSVLRRALRVYLPLAIVLVGYLCARHAVLGGLGREAAKINVIDNVIARPGYGLGPGDSGFLARWGTPLAIFAKAAGRLAWPHPLSWDYSYAAIESVRRWGDWRMWCGAAVLWVCMASIVVFWVVSRRGPEPGDTKEGGGGDRRGDAARAAGAAIGIALATYAVVANWFVVVGAAFAERYLYLPSAGFCMLVGAMLAWLQSDIAWMPPAVRGWIGRAGLAVAGAAVIAGGAATVARNRDFRSMAELDAADLKSQPRSARLLCSMSLDFFKLAQQESTGAEQRPQLGPRAREHYALALARANDAIAVLPEYAEAWRMAGLAHWGLKEPDDSLRCLQRYFELGDARNENAAIVAAQIYTARGQYAEAIAVLERFVGDNPKAATALNNLAWKLLTAQPETLRDPARAAQYAQRAVELQPTIGDFLDTYYAALVAVGRGEEARRMLQAALPRVPANDPQRPGLVRKLTEP